MNNLIVALRLHELFSPCQSIHSVNIEEQDLEFALRIEAKELEQMVDEMREELARKEASMIDREEKLKREVFVILQIG